jgi:hypothetical protein
MLSLQTFAEYAAWCELLIQHYVSTNHIVRSTFLTDVRSRTTGLLRGIITFEDASELHFSEYIQVDIIAEQLVKMMYTFHYQNAAKELLFRYDNSPHKPPLAMRDHKHTPDGITTYTQPPTFDSVLAEILLRFK